MALDTARARSVGLIPASGGMPPPARLNTALPTMLASVLQQGGIKAPTSLAAPISATIATPPSTASLAAYGSSPPIAGYADGGAVPPPGQMPQLGAPQRPGGMAQPAAPQAPAAPLDPTQVQAELQKFIRQHPQQVQQIQQVVQAALQSGELSSEELNLAVQLAVAAAQNPAMYPKLRQMAIQKGLATEEDLPQQYDQSIVFALILAGQAMQSGGAGITQGMEPMQPQGAPQQLKDGGGVIPRNSNPRDDFAEGRKDNVKIAVSGGEYVIPAHIVRQKGTDFFDKMIGKDVVK